MTGSRDDITNPTGAGASDDTVPSPADPASGRKRIGKYTLIRRIGRGGMGVIYLAEQDNPRRSVALKMMRGGLSRDTDQRRFEYESQILARLRHPNIAEVYEAGTYQDDDTSVPYFAMEYISGARSVTEYADSRQLAIPARLQLFLKVCYAVHYGHLRGVIHRDLKPENILVDAMSEPRIIDFGVARVTDVDVMVTSMRTEVGHLVGTLQYMSPEQCHGEPDTLDMRSDIYSLGVVLYELVCDALPYDLDGLSLYERIRVITEQPPRPPRSSARTLEADLEAIILRALRKERDQRYQSAAELADDVERYLDDRPVKARHSTVTNQLRLFARRHQGLVLGAAVLLMSLLVAAGVIVTLDQRRMQKRLRTTVELQMDICAENSIAALEFDDPDAASRVLHSLHSDPHVLAAATYSRRGELFAAFSPVEGPPAVPAADHATNADGNPSVLNVLRPVRVGDNEIGSVFVSYSKRPLRDHLTSQLFVVLFAMSAAVIVALTLLLLAQRASTSRRVRQSERSRIVAPSA